MDTKSEISEFLTSRRARLTPEQAGVASYGARRVPGLRREEVAVLAGVSVAYYTRLERGNMNGASDGVLEALVRALQLDEAERAHLFDLARAARPATALLHLAITALSTLHSRPRRRLRRPRLVLLSSSLRPLGRERLHFAARQRCLFARCNSAHDGASSASGGLRSLG